MLDPLPESFNLGGQIAHAKLVTIHQDFEAGGQINAAGFAVVFRLRIRSNFFAGMGGMASDKPAEYTANQGSKKCVIPRKHRNFWHDIRPHPSMVTH